MVSGFSNSFMTITRLKFNKLKVFFMSMAMIGKIKIRSLSKMEMKKTSRLFISLTFKGNLQVVYYMQVFSSYMPVILTKYRDFFIHFHSSRKHGFYLLIYAVSINAFQINQCTNFIHFFSSFYTVSTLLHFLFHQF